MKKTLLFLFVSIHTSFAQNQLKLGANRFIHNTGDGNTFMGLQAGSNVTTGNSNTSLGYYSGNAITVGAANTYLGYLAGSYNGLGSSNVFVGFAAGWRNTANSNVIVGRSAGAFSTTGTQNVFVGNLAGLGVENGTNSGSNNTFLGESSGLKISSGSTNTFIGKSAGYENTTGSTNVFVGYETGKANTIGANNVYVGGSANGFGTNAASLQRAAAVGYNARVSINDAIVLGDFQNNNVKVGIGVHDPQHRLDVKGVINMRAAFNSPSLKINGRDFLGLDEQGEFIVSNFKMKYQSENQWADRVFKKGYILMPLAQLEDYIQEHEHLPGIPTASEAVEKGVSTQEMTAKLLEKVEELTRYVIELKNENEGLKKDYQEVLKRLPISNK
ncbi:hypothetical protein [Runella aurantiaca]|uniref:TMF family protein n=1 Tax=Runella aurantiaca TaxID=2282308 RepID=A0A369I5S0_9BACT|nr:hypothetical protein [Runella aurantiaca]RDB04392.1 hypothetical protein DVG78_18305 [Runella aurantiaca]